jgi:hypothetical protein
MLPGAKATVYAEVGAPDEPGALITIPTKDGTLQMHLKWSVHTPIVEWGIQNTTHPIVQLLRSQSEPREPWQQPVEDDPPISMTDALAALMPIAIRWGKAPVPSLQALQHWLNAELLVPGVVA